MKKKRSFTIEEDIDNEIQKYDRKYGFNNMSLALERMLLERRSLIEKVELLERLVQGGVTISSNREETQKPEEKEPSIFQSFYEDMPD
ncbi:hypothetical protein [Metaclostridioides mangenotii]|uniref:hypothetical protein n=1 Tax=Metaclostridioides mangenotii TaxID=1540 RepID=UPI000463EC24|nr:hypothetical protein [Clostridioides mangenotii]